MTANKKITNKKYNDTWSVSYVTVQSDKRQGHGRDKDLYTQALAEARKEFEGLCQKYGAHAKILAVENLRESLDLFRNGRGWTQGTEKERTLNNNGNVVDKSLMSYCAIGAIHKADGQAEYLARLATNLAAGELFPARAMSTCESYLGEGDKDATAEDFEMPDVVEFNDHDDTTYPDVAKVFRRAIEILG